MSAPAHVKVRHVNLHADEFLAAVAGEMTPAELGVYWMVCLLIYSRGKPIKNDLEWIRAKFIRADLRVIKSAVERLIDDGKVDLSDGYLSVNRCLSELEVAGNRIVTAQQNGGKGGRPSRKNKGLENTLGSDAETALKPLTTNHKPQEENTANAVSVVTTDEPRLVAEQMFAMWKQICQSLPLPRKLDPDRITKLHNRWKDSFEKSLEQWEAFCRRVEGAPWLTGQNDSGWKATIDWVLQPINLRKIEEGNYDDRIGGDQSRQRTGSHPPKSSALAAALGKLRPPGGEGGLFDP